MVCRITRNKAPCGSLLLFLLALGTFVSGLPITGTPMRPEYQKIIAKPFYYGNETQILRIPTASVHVANEALIDVYCHLYANSTNDITLLLDPDFWNLTTIPVEIGETVNVTVTNGNLDLPSDGAAKLQADVFRTSVNDVVQGEIILGVITSGWQKASWEGLPFLLMLLSLALIKRTKKN